MSKVWSYVAAVLGGALTMAIIGWKWLAGDDYTMEVKKIKNKRTSGTTTTTVPMHMDTATAKSDKVEKETKKAARKLKRKAKRDAKKTI